MTQQTNMTAVGAIYEQLEVNDPEFWNANMIIDWLKENKERFIKMEKEQMKTIYEHGSFSLLETGHGDTFNEYYNKIYNDGERNR